MADKTDKIAENVPGKYYVDSSCSACQVCISSAPENFKMDDDEEYAYVYKQPADEDEEEACRESLEGCPEEAIGDDGE
jgi:ferredoxin